MTKLGSCTIAIEPHAFEAILYTVREPQVTFLQPMGLPPQRPFPQYGPPVGHTTQPAPPYNHLKQSPHPQMQARPLTNAPPSSSSFGPGNITQPRPPGNGQLAPHSTNSMSAPVQGPLGPMNSVTPSNQQQASKPSPDPVIQMLATKAATDHELKALMRVVASGKASQAELRVFQGHIDELNGILQARSQANRPLVPNSAAASPLPGRTSSTDPMFAPHGQQILNPANPNGAMSTSSSASIKTEPSTQYYPEPPPPLRSKAPPPPPKPDIIAVVFEFTTGGGDRFLLPKYSILEYLPGGTRVIASFLVVRKGSASASQAYDSKLDYYQPVTIHFSTPHARILEPLARVVAPIDEVRRYMDDIMDKMTRARHVHLALQLPRASDDLVGNNEAELEQNGVDDLKAVYTAPSALVPLKKQSKTRVLAPVLS